MENAVGLVADRQAFKRQFILKNPAFFGHSIAYLSNQNNL
jgi:hypothetical protein